MSITLLDGSIGQELVKRLGAPPTPLWSTRVMLERPELVRDVHLEYFQSGADIATLNSYGVLRDRLANNGIEAQFDILHQTALKLAQEARDVYGGGKIASSLGPLGASYRPDLAPKVEVSKKAYSEIIALHDAAVDVHLLETVSGLRLAEGILAGCEKAKKPIWLALSVSDENGTLLRSHEPLKDVAPLIERYKPDAILLNCSIPEVIKDGLEIIKNFGLPFGAYANGFTEITDDFKVVNQTVDTLKARTDLSPLHYANFAESWVDMGATIIGGCCEVGPLHIQELKKRFG